MLDKEILAAETRLGGTQNEEEQRRLREALIQLREFKGVFTDRRAA